MEVRIAFICRDLMKLNILVLALEAWGGERVKLKCNVSTSTLCNDESLESEKFEKDAG